jgi:protease secretion system outer membrane protein
MKTVRMRLARCSLSCTANAVLRSVAVGALVLAVGLASTSASGADAAATVLGPADALAAARSADPRFRADRFELDAVRQDRLIVRSELYPNAVYTLRRARSLGHLDADNPLGEATRRELDYQNRNSALSARQSLYNPEAWARGDSADARVAAAESVYIGREAELMTRVCVAYLDLAMAHEDVTLADAAIASYAEQQRSALRRFELGDGTRTEVADAQTRLEQARVNLIDATGALQVARRALAQITGISQADARRLRADGGWLGLEPQTELAWTDMALQRNPFIQAQHHAVRAAEFEFEARRKAHLPKVDLVGAVTFASNDSLSTLSQKSLQRSLGVTLSVPILTGGRLQASAVQAVALTEKERSDLLVLTDQVLLEVRRQFVVAQAATDKIEALQRAVSAAQLAVQGTDAGWRAGTRSFWEVLEAQRRMFVTQRELIRSVRDALVARVRLQAVSGTLDDQAVSALGASLR